MRFQSELRLEGKTATGLEVPANVVDGLGSSRRPAVRVTINGFTYPSTIASMGGRFLIPVSAQVRAAAGVVAGDVVDVDVELDTVKREVVVPPDLTEHLGEEPTAAAFFAGLSFSHQRAYVDWIESAKKADTRENRVRQAVEMLGQGKKRA